MEKAILNEKDGLEINFYLNASFTKKIIHFNLMISVIKYNNFIIFFIVILFFTYVVYNWANLL